MRILGRFNGGRPDLSLRRRVLSLPTLVSVALAAMLLVFLITRFDVDLGATWRTVSQGDPLLYILAIGVHYLTFVFRGARWRVFLHNIHTDGPDQREQVPSTFHCGRLVLLGWFVNSISGFHLGDAYRAYAYTEDTGASFSRTAGTVLAERLVDVVMVFGLLLVGALLLIVTGDTPSLVFLVIAFGLVLLGGAGLLVMRFFRTRLARLLPTPLEGAYHRLHAGTMGSFRQLHIVFLLSLASWFCEVGRLYLVTQAVGLPVGVELVLFVTLANALLTTIGLTPGGLGIVEPGITGLLMLTLSQEEAVAVALLDRSISYVSIIVVGGLFFAIRQSLRARRRAAERRVQARSGTS